MIRNIIFDWSGTLVDDLPAVWEATNYVLTQAERPEMSLEQFRAEFCLPFTIFYDRHTPHIPLPQLETWFHSRFRAGAGFGLRAAARARVPGVLPGEPAAHLPAQHRPPRPFRRAVGRHGFWAVPG